MVSVVSFAFGSLVTLSVKVQTWTDCSLAARVIIFLLLDELVAEEFGGISSMSISWMACTCFFCSGNRSTNSQSSGSIEFLDSCLLDSSLLGFWIFNRAWTKFPLAWPKTKWSDSRISIKGERCRLFGSFSSLILAMASSKDFLENLETTSGICLSSRANWITSSLSGARYSTKLGLESRDLSPANGAISFK